MSEEKIIVIRETARESWVRDASAYVLAVLLIGTGVLLGSTAMQWSGAAVFFVALFAWAAGSHKEYTMTIPQARSKLDEWEASND